MCGVAVAAAVAVTVAVGLYSRAFLHFPCSSSGGGCRAFSWEELGESVSECVYAAAGEKQQLRVWFSGPVWGPLSQVSPAREPGAPLSPLPSLQASF